MQPCMDKLGLQMKVLNTPPTLNIDTLLNHLCLNKSRKLSCQSNNTFPEKTGSDWAVKALHKDSEML